MQSGTKTELLIQRLRWHVSRLQTAPQFVAVLDCLFEIRPSRTSPAFEELTIVDDRLIFARARGERTFRYFVGRRDQLLINILGLIKHLGLGVVEREYAISRVEGIKRRATR